MARSPLVHLFLPAYELHSLPPTHKQRSTRTESTTTRHTFDMQPIPITQHMTNFELTTENDEHYTVVDSSGEATQRTEDKTQAGEAMRKALSTVSCTECVSSSSEKLEQC